MDEIIKKAIDVLQSYPFMNCHDVYYVEEHQVSREEYIKLVTVERKGGDA